MASSVSMAEYWAHTRLKASGSAKAFPLFQYSSCRSRTASMRSCRRRRRRSRPSMSTRTSRPRTVVLGGSWRLAPPEDTASRWERTVWTMSFSSFLRSSSVLHVASLCWSDISSIEGTRRTGNGCSGTAAATTNDILTLSASQSQRNSIEFNRVGNEKESRPSEHTVHPPWTGKI